MNKSLSILVLLVSYFVVAQEDGIQKMSTSEIKVNAFNLIAFCAADFSYEYLLNENESIGIGLLLKLKPLQIRDRRLLEPDISHSRTFSITPYYRCFLSKKYAKGFFVEGFGMYAMGKEIYSSIEDIGRTLSIVDYEDFRLGLGLGVKMTLKKNIVLTINFGMGFTIITNFDYDLNARGGFPNDYLDPRGGISIGYRF